MLESRLYQGSTTRSSSPPLSPVGQVCPAASQPMGEVFQRRACCSTGPRRGPHSIRYWSLGVGRSCQGCQVLTNSTPGPGMCLGQGVQGCTALGGPLKARDGLPHRSSPGKLRHSQAGVATAQGSSSWGRGSSFSSPGEGPTCTGAAGPTPQGCPAAPRVCPPPAPWLRSPPAAGTGAGIGTWQPPHTNGEFRGGCDRAGHPGEGDRAGGDAPSQHQGSKEERAGATNPRQDVW